MLEFFICVGISVSNFLQTPINVFVTRKFGIRASRLFINLQGFYFYLINNKECRAIIKASKHIRSFARTKTSTLSYYRKIFSGIFNHYCEKIIMGYWPLQKTTDFLKNNMQVINKKCLDNAVKDGRGAIFVTGHYGAVEFLPLALNSLGYKVSMICRFKTASLKKELYRRANYLGILLIDADEPNVAYQAFSAIKDGRILITECDEFKKWRPSNVEIDVFFKRAKRDTTLDCFFKRAKVDSVFGVIRREPGCKYSLCLEPLLEKGENESLSGTSWHALEHHIYQYPYQWYQWKEFACQILDNKKHVKKDSYIPAADTVSVASYS
jgi:lauroyl/myristoyl acyltransferase